MHTHREHQHEPEAVSYRKPDLPISLLSTGTARVPDQTIRSTNPLDFNLTEEEHNHLRAMCSGLFSDNPEYREHARALRDSCLPRLTAFLEQQNAYADCQGVWDRRSVEDDYLSEMLARPQYDYYKCPCGASTCLRRFDHARSS